MHPLKDIIFLCIALTFSYHHLRRLFHNRNILNDLAIAPEIREKAFWDFLKHFLCILGDMDIPVFD